MKTLHLEKNGIRGLSISESFENQGFLKTIPVILQRIYICNPIYKKVGKNWQF